jgi:hypothetical protein
MHSIQIRKVDQTVYNRLKKAAQLHHRSISNEALSLFEKALGVAQYENLDGLFGEMDSTVKETRAKYGDAPSSTTLLREDRDR